MSRPVVSVRPHAPARATVAVLVRSGCTDAPVVDADGLLRGVVSEADLVRGLALVGAGRGTGPLVRDVMTSSPGVVGPDTELVDVELLVPATARRSVPVVEHGRLVGVVTRRDLLRALAPGRRDSVTAAVPDAAGGS